METDGGGWTVFQRRQDGSVEFHKNWTDYEDGFGNLNGEFWLGLGKINRLTKEESNTLRVDLGDFNGNTRYAQYTTFSVGDNYTEYTLTVGGYSGTAGDSLPVYRLNGIKFSTRDNDNDWSSDNCAQSYHGGWWFRQCFQSHLNGLYQHNPVISSRNGIIWSTWKNYEYSLKFTEMKTRNNN